jgi:hypothetical protein
MSGCVGLLSPKRLLLKKLIYIVFKESYYLAKNDLAVGLGALIV